MKATLWMLMALIAALTLLSACPRNNGEKATTPEINSTASDSTAKQQMRDEALGTTTPETNPAAQEDAMANTNNEVTTVHLETTKGKIVLAVHPAWSPLGAKHFLELVNAGFYDGAPWFRVMDGFVAQCGVAADPAMNEKWANATIQDEPVIQGNQRGFVAFGQSPEPNSRSTHFFINYADNSTSLDGQGFACFAEVIEGMDVADKLTRCEFADQGGLAMQGGLEKFKTMFPKADYITKATVGPVWQPPTDTTAGTAGEAAPAAPGAPGSTPPAPPAAPEGGK
jgi:peptidyl-prolyl cis-trans isomerase A (cyclophilin A)